jgi:hypothetical protein
MLGGLLTRADDASTRSKFCRGARRGWGGGAVKRKGDGGDRKGRETRPKEATATLVSTTSTLTVLSGYCFLSDLDKN